MNPRSSLLATTLVLGLSLGCTNNRPAASDVRPSESGGTPVPSADAAPRPGAAPGMSAQGEAPSGGMAAAESKPAIYDIKDSGIRCIAPPCPAYIARRADRPDEDGLQVTSLDLSALNLSQPQQDTLFEATHRGTGVKLEATVKTVPKAGPGGTATVLVVSRLIDGK